MEVPTSWLSEHAPTILRFRPEGIEQSSVLLLEYFAYRALSEHIQLLMEVTNTPYDFVCHFNIVGIVDFPGRLHLGGSVLVFLRTQAPLKVRLPFYQDCLVELDFVCGSRIGYSSFGLPIIYISCDEPCYASS